MCCTRVTRPVGAGDDDGAGAGVVVDVGADVVVGAVELGLLGLFRVDRAANLRFGINLPGGAAPDAAI